MFTEGRIQVSGDVKTLLDTTGDCLRFVTEFFEVISQSAPHIYHSALLLAPRSSIVWRLYSQQTHSVARVVTGIAASWDPCASVRVVETNGLVWSPCGQFIAVKYRDRIEVQDPNTLERLSVLKPPSNWLEGSLRSFDFSPNGHLVAGFCHML